MSRNLDGVCLSKEGASNNIVVACRETSPYQLSNGRDFGLAKLPKELLDVIQGHLSTNNKTQTSGATMLALGLTCYPLYLKFKAWYPEVFKCIIHRGDFPDDNEKLKVIQSFVGPSYRWIHGDRTGFIWFHSSVSSDREVDIVERFLVQLDSQKCAIMQAAGCGFPDPRGLGVAWYDQIREIVLSPEWEMMSSSASQKDQKELKSFKMYAMDERWGKL